MKRTPSQNPERFPSCSPLRGNIILQGMGLPRFQSCLAGNQIETWTWDNCWPRNSLKNWGQSIKCFIIVWGEGGNGGRVCVLLSHLEKKSCLIHCYALPLRQKSPLVCSKENCFCHFANRWIPILPNVNSEINCTVSCFSQEIWKLTLALIPPPTTISLSPPLPLPPSLPLSFLSLPAFPT